MTNAWVGRTRIGVDVSCDVRYENIYIYIYIIYIYIWDDAVRLPTICDDLMDFGHDTNQFYSIT